MLFLANHSRFMAQKRSPKGEKSFKNITADASLLRGQRKFREVTVENYPIGEKNSGASSSKSSIVSSSSKDSSLVVTLKESVDRVPFISGNPEVETTHGILHLYKEKYEIW